MNPLLSYISKAILFGMLVAFCATTLYCLRFLIYPKPIYPPRFLFVASRRSRRFVRQIKTSLLLWIAERADDFGGILFCLLVFGLTIIGLIISAK